MTIPAAVGRDAGQQLRVLHLVSSDAFAGIERHALQLAVELRRLGCDAELACPPSAEILRRAAHAQGVPVHPPDDGSSKAWLGSVARTAMRSRPDTVHVHDGHGAVAGALLAPLAGAFSVRTQHFVRPASVTRPGWQRSASLALHRALNRRLDGFIAVSQAAADGARERRETGRAKVAVIPPGIRMPSDEEVLRARAVRNAIEQPAVAFVGRLEPERRVDVLIKAIPGIRATVPGCEFVIAGAGSAEQRLREEARRLGLDGVISWKGWVSDPAAILSRSHVYVNTIPWEGFGMAMAEAMAFELPVVAVSSGASAELVEDGVTGSLVSPDDPKSFATAVTELLTDLPRAAAMGERARLLAVERYGVEHAARATLAFYRKLAATSP